MDEIPSIYFQGNRKSFMYGWNTIRYGFIRFIANINTYAISEFTTIHFHISVHRALKSSVTQPPLKRMRPASVTSSHRNLTPMQISHQMPTGTARTWKEPTRLQQKNIKISNIHCASKKIQDPRETFLFIFNAFVKSKCSTIQKTHCVNCIDRRINYQFK